MRFHFYLYQSMGNIRVRIAGKIVSPLLGKFFYKRGYDRTATTAISVEEVRDAVMAQLNSLVVSVR
jgi:hypothetical protein